nr:hypothetical protein [Pseudomonadota bacterium]
INVYERLAKWGEPVVQGLYFTKDTPPRIAAFYKQGPLFHNIREYPPDRLMPIDSGGTGVMLTHTEIFLYLDFPYFEYYRTPLTGKALVGEDTYFMDQCLERGIPMFMDTGCKSTGLPKKEHASEEDYFEFLEAQNRYLASRH